MYLFKYVYYISNLEFHIQKCTKEDVKAVKGLNCIPWCVTLEMAVTLDWFHRVFEERKAVLQLTRGSKTM